MTGRLQTVVPSPGWSADGRRRRAAPGYETARADRPPPAVGNRDLQRVLLQAPGLLGSELCRGGNRALGRRAQIRTLARYDTGEHALFGSDRVVFVKDDVQITEAEMITMGDLYERPEDVFQADTSELRGLVTLIRRDRDAYLGLGNAKHVSDDEWEKATPKGPHRKKTYLELAEENITHFGPSPTKSGAYAALGQARDHKAEWERIHKQALDVAHAGSTPADLQRALALNAFAAHFLTDAFSSGHLLNKEDMMDYAKRGPGGFVRQHRWGWIFTENDFTRKVAEQVLKDPKAGPKLRHYMIRIVRWQGIDAENLSELLYGFATDDDMEAKFYSPFAKAVHDRLNKAGVEVTNARGDGPWRLRGDDYLLPDDPWAVSREQYESSKVSSRETLRVGRAAVAESVANVMEASKTSGALDYTKLFARVWAYTPSPTATGRREIEAAVDALLDLRRPEAVDAFVKIMVDHVDLLIEKLTDPAVNRLATPEEVERRRREDLLMHVH
jgi:hypothetical protein